MICYRCLDCINKIDAVNSDTFFIFSDSYASSNNIKLTKQKVDTNIRLHGFSFKLRIVNSWNSLPNDVVCADSINMFKSRLKTFWYNKNLKYQFKFYNQ